MEESNNTDSGFTTPQVPQQTVQTPVENQTPLKKPSRFSGIQKWSFLVFIFLFAGIGGYLLVTSHAASLTLTSANLDTKNSINAAPVTEATTTTFKNQQVVEVKNTLSSTTPGSVPATRINAGGPAYTGVAGAAWMADTYATGGTTDNQAAGHAIANTTNPTLYQTERYGNMTYNIPTKNGTYAVILHFAEIYSGCQKIGCRKFNVSVNGTPFLTNFDIYAKAGGYTADTEQSTANVTNGNVAINFTSVANSAQISAIEIVPVTTTLRINSGGPAVTNPTTGNVWQADAYFTGGTTDAAGVGHTIKNPNAGFQTPYQTERYGNMTYNIPVANGTYRVVLYFAEIYSACQKVGCRKFNVSVNGTPFLTNFDIYAKVGGYAADTEQTTANVTNGKITIKFTNVTNNAKISAIAILPASTSAVTTASTGSAGQAAFSTSLANGAYQICPSVHVTSANAVNGVIRVNQYTNGAQGTLLASQPYTASPGADYATLPCLPLTLSASAGVEITITNGTSGSTMRVGSITLTSQTTPPPPSQVNATLSASPTSVQAGGAATLTWNSTNAIACTATGGWTGALATSGTKSTGALNSTATYTITCTGGGGSANASTTVTVVPVAPPPSTSGLSVRVSGNRLVNGAGTPLILRGVNMSGTEYSCVQSGGIWDGQPTQATVTAMLSWHVHIVRIPLNEDCWLGNAGPGAATYQSAIVNWVKLLNSNGIYAILDLHWTGTSATSTATGQQPMPDSYKAPAFWTSVANTFKSNPAAIFDLFNEPHPGDWGCWKNGGTCSGISFPVAGMQTLVNTVRATGSTNVLMLGGLAWSNDLTGWIANKPTDPLNQLAVSAHIYGGNACSSLTCLNTNDAPVAAQYPIVIGELGEFYNGYSNPECGSSVLNNTMTWADQHNASYTNWTWNTWGDCEALISNANGAVNTASGTANQYVHDHLVSFP